MIPIIVIFGLVAGGFALGYALRDMISRQRRRRGRVLDGWLL